MELTPKDLSWRNVYKLMVGAVVPRPIAFVSTISDTGVLNLAAFSFFNAVCPQPFILSFAPMLRGEDGEKKDTLRNIERTGEFVVNAVTDRIVRPMNETAPEFPPEIDEFKVSGLTPEPSRRVRPPRVLESPVAMECKLLQIVNFGTQPGAGSLVLGEVVHMRIHDDVYEDGKILPDLLAPIGRMAGDEYIRTTDRFQLKRPILRV